MKIQSTKPITNGTLLVKPFNRKNIQSTEIEIESLSPENRLLLKTDKINIRTKNNRKEKEKANNFNRINRMNHSSIPDQLPIQNSIFTVNGEEIAEIPQFSDNAFISLPLNSLLDNKSLTDYISNDPDLLKMKDSLKAHSLENSEISRSPSRSKNGIYSPRKTSPEITINRKRLSVEISSQKIPQQQLFVDSALSQFAELPEFKNMHFSNYSNSPSKSDNADAEPDENQTGYFTNTGSLSSTQPSSVTLDPQEFSSGPSSKPDSNSHSPSISSYTTKIGSKSTTGDAVSLDYPDNPENQKFLSLGNTNGNNASVDTSVSNQNGCSGTNEKQDRVSSGNTQDTAELPSGVIPIVSSEPTGSSLTECDSTKGLNTRSKSKPIFEASSKSKAKGKPRTNLKTKVKSKLRTDEEVLPSQTVLVESKISSDFTNLGTLATSTTTNVVRKRGRPSKPPQPQISRELNPLHCNIIELVEIGITNASTSTDTQPGSIQSGILAETQADSETNTSLSTNTTIKANTNTESSSDASTVKSNDTVINSSSYPKSKKYRSAPPPPSSRTLRQSSRASTINYALKPPGFDFPLNYATFPFNQTKHSAEKRALKKHSSRSNSETNSTKTSIPERNSKISQKAPIIDDVASINTKQNEINASGTLPTFTENPSTKTRTNKDKNRNKPRDESNASRSRGMPVLSQDSLGLNEKASNPNTHSKSKSSSSFLTNTSFIPRTNNNESKPREERDWDEFYPLLDLDLPILFKGTAGILTNKQRQNSNPLDEDIDIESISGDENESENRKHNSAGLSLLAISSTLLHQSDTDLDPNRNPKHKVKNKNKLKLKEKENNCNSISKTKLKNVKKCSTVLAIKGHALSLPKAKYSRFDNFSSVENVKMPENHYIRYISPRDKERLETVEYDMDDLDYEWLQIVSKNVESTGIKLSEDLMEAVMDLLEKEWFDLTRDIQNQLSQKNLASLAAEDAACNICEEEECDNSNAIVFCDGCNLAVHQDCYGVPYIPEGQWLCRKCMLSPGQDVSCLFCPHRGGAFKKTTNNQWAHLMCALWIPEVGISNTVYMEPIDSVEMIPKSRWKLVCTLCGLRGGACIQCSVKHCFLAFHVQCAFKARLYMKMKLNQSSSGSIFNIFCHKHTPSDHSKSIDLEAPKRALGLLPAISTVNENLVPINPSKLKRPASPIEEARSSPINVVGTPDTTPVKKPRGRPRKTPEDCNSPRAFLSGPYQVGQNSGSTGKHDPYFPISPQKTRPVSALSKRPASPKNHDQLTTSSTYPNPNLPHLANGVPISSSLSLTLTSKVLSLESPVANQYIFSRLINFLSGSGMCNKFGQLKRHWMNAAQLFCKYWSLKRKQRNGAPLIKRLYLEPWTSSISSLQFSTTDFDDNEVNIKAVYSDLVSLRKIARGVLTRETLKNQIAKSMVNAITAVVYPLKASYLEVLDFLGSRDKFGTFAKPVYLEDAPCYLDVIKHPMDLGTVRKKVASFEYSCLQEFESDLYLIFNNCISYNENKSYHNNLARKLLAITKDLIIDLKAQAQLLGVSDNEYQTLDLGSKVDLDSAILANDSQPTRSGSDSGSFSSAKGVKETNDQKNYEKLLGADGMQLGRSRIKQQWSLVLESGLFSSLDEPVHPIPDPKKVYEDVYHELFPKPNSVKSIISVKPRKKRKLAPLLPLQSLNSDNSTSLQPFDDDRASAVSPINGKSKSCKKKPNVPSETSNLTKQEQIQTQEQAKGQVRAQKKKQAQAAGQEKAKTDHPPPQKSEKAMQQGHRHTNSYSKPIRATRSSNSGSSIGTAHKNLINLIHSEKQFEVIKVSVDSLTSSSFSLDTTKTSVVDGRLLRSNKVSTKLSTDATTAKRFKQTLLSTKDPAKRILESSTKTSIKASAKRSTKNSARTEKKKQTKLINFRAVNASNQLIEEKKAATTNVKKEMEAVQAYSEAGVKVKGQIDATRPKTHFYKPKAKKLDGRFILPDNSPAIFNIPTEKWPTGTLVWASMASFPWFPAEIFDPASKMVPEVVHNDRKSPEANCVLVYFFDVQLNHRTWKWLSPYRVLKLGVDSELDEQLKLGRSAKSSSGKKQVLAAYEASMKIRTRKRAAI